jgi:hypothetical protein
MNYFQKYRFQLITVALLLLSSFIFYVSQSVARKELATYYSLHGSSDCGAGARPTPPLFELSPALFGYNYRLENNAHLIVKGTISISGNINETSTEQIICPLQ